LFKLITRSLISITALTVALTYSDMAEAGGRKKTAASARKRGNQSDEEAPSGRPADAQQQNAALSGLLSALDDPIEEVPVKKEKLDEELGAGVDLAYFIHNQEVPQAAAAVAQPAASAVQAAAPKPQPQFSTRNQQFLAAIASGDVAAMNKLGQLYAAHRVPGLTVELSNKMAHNLFVTAARKNEPEAVYNLARLFQMNRFPGKTAEQCAETAMELFKQAALLGSVEAQNILLKQKQAIEATKQYLLTPHEDWKAVVSRATVLMLNEACEIAEQPQTERYIARNTYELKNSKRWMNDLMAETPAGLGELVRPLLQPLFDSYKLWLNDPTECLQALVRSPIFVRAVKINPVMKSHLPDDFAECCFVHPCGNEELLTFGREEIALAKKTLTFMQTGPNVNLESDPVIVKQINTTARRLVNLSQGIKEENPVAIAFPVAIEPNFNSLDLCCEFMQHTLKRAEFADAVMSDENAKSAEFQALGKVFDRLRSRGRSINELFHKFLVQNIPYRDRLVLEDQRFSFLKPPAAAARRNDDVDDEG
jgi:TPR repeat protein